MIMNYSIITYCIHSECYSRLHHPSPLSLFVISRRGVAKRLDVFVFMTTRQIWLHLLHCYKDTCNMEIHSYSKTRLVSLVFFAPSSPDICFGGTIW